MLKSEQLSFFPSYHHYPLCRCSAPFIHTMRNKTDVEAGAASDETCDLDDSQPVETESLLPTQIIQPLRSPPSTKSTFTGKPCGQYTFGVLHISIAFGLGVFACLVAQAVVCRKSCFTLELRSSEAVTEDAKQDVVSMLAPPYVGSTSINIFPPANPTNAYPSLFPTYVGYPGGTPTGAEAAVIATAPAYPMHTGQCSHQLLIPKLLEGQTPLTLTNETVGFKQKPKFNLFRSWGNLSPWFSVGRGRFGVDSSPETPETCRVTGLHFLHRHGARYPTAWGALSYA